VLTEVPYGHEADEATMSRDNDDKATMNGESSDERTINGDEDEIYAREGQLVGEFLAQQHTDSVLGM
jgi:hypothetical protein